MSENKTSFQVTTAHQFFKMIIDQALVGTNTTMDQLAEKLESLFRAEGVTQSNVMVQSIVAGVMLRVMRGCPEFSDMNDVLTALGCSTHTTTILPEDTPEVKYPAIWSELIDTLDVPVRVVNCLRTESEYGTHNGRLDYIGQLIALSVSDLHRIHGMGSKAVNYVIDSLKDKGLELGTDTTGWTVPSPKESS